MPSAWNACLKNPINSVFSQRGQWLGVVNQLSWDPLSGRREREIHSTPSGTQHQNEIKKAQKDTELE